MDKDLLVLFAEMLRKQDVQADILQSLIGVVKDGNEAMYSFFSDQRELNADQREFNAAQREFNAAQREFNAAQMEFNADQREFNADQREFNRNALISFADQREFNKRALISFDDQREFNRNVLKSFGEQKEFNNDQKEFNKFLLNEIKDIKTLLASLVQLDSRVKAIEIRERNFDERLARLENLSRAS